MSSHCYDALIVIPSLCHFLNDPVGEFLFIMAYIQYNLNIMFCFVRYWTELVNSVRYYFDGFTDISQQGLYSLSGKTSYCQISRSLEAARLGVMIIVLLSAALLPRCLSNFRVLEKV